MEVCRYSLNPDFFKDNPIDNCLDYEELIDDIQDITKPFPGNPINGRVLYDIGYMENNDFVSGIDLELPIVYQLF